MREFLWLIPLLPLLGFLILTLTAGRLPKQRAAWVGVGSVGLSAALVALIGMEFFSSEPEPYTQVLWTWMSVGEFQPKFALYLDALSMTMMFVITGVGFLIHLYSVGYMADDPGFSRFFAYMNLFVAAMLMLVLGDNLVLLYLGWEGVGLCSYLLIGFWYTDSYNGYAARKAFVVTRVGDTAMALGLFLLFAQLGTLDIQALMQSAEANWEVGSTLAVVTAALLLGGAVGKSAQLPLQTWLPDAMAGPTPISALIHAATMVTAGVYLIARTNVIFTLAPSMQFVVGAIGAVTLIMSGFTALTQTDIKRVLAYSTVSQIGYMFLALGVGAWSAAIFHLMTHAFFKALLFLGAGAVILSMHHEQDIFKMGGLFKRLPISFWTFLIGTCALVALPFTSGYYSKHDILLAAYDSSVLLWLAGVFGALLTAIYSFRLVYVVFFGPDKTHAKEKLPWTISLPLIVLAGLSIFGGMLETPLQSVFPAGSEETAHGGGFVNFVTSAAPFIGLTLAVLYFVTGTLSIEELAESPRGKRWRQLWFSGWGMDSLYDTLFVNPYKWVAAINKRDIVDRIYDFIAWVNRWFNGVLSQTQNGQMRWYAASVAFGAVLIISFGVFL